MKRDSREAGPGTQAVWGGEEEYLLQGATQVPVVHSVSLSIKRLPIARRRTSMRIENWQWQRRGENTRHVQRRN